jgi:hypothetical protein
MPRVGCEPTIPVFEQANAFHALDRTATVSGALQYEVYKLNQIAEEIISKYYQ